MEKELRKSRTVTVFIMWTNYVHIFSLVNTFSAGCKARFRSYSAFAGGDAAGELLAFVEQVPAIPDEGDKFLGYDRSVLVFDDVFLNASSLCVMRKC